MVLAQFDIPRVLSAYLSLPLRAPQSVRFFFQRSFRLFYFCIFFFLLSRIEPELVLALARRIIPFALLVYWQNSLNFFLTSLSLSFVGRWSIVDHLAARGTYDSSANGTESEKSNTQSTVSVWKNNRTWNKFDLQQPWSTFSNAERAKQWTFTAVFFS